MPNSSYVFDVRATGTDRAAEQVKKTVDSLGEMTEAGKFVQEKFGKLQAAFKVAALAEFAKQTIETAEAMDKLARVSGTSLEFLSKLKSGAKETGAEFDTLLSAYQEFSRTSANLSAGIGRSGDRLHAFQILGFNERDIRTKSAEQNIAALTKRMQEGRFTAAQYAAGIRVMGESFRELAAASEKGLGTRLARPASEQSTTRFLAEVGHEASRHGGTSVGWGKRALTGFITLSELLAGSVYNLYSASTLIGSRKAGEISDDLFLDRARVNLNTFGDEATTREMEKRLGEHGFARQTKQRISSLQRQLRRTLGPDAEDVLEELQDSGASQQQYERVLRRARRASRRKLDELGAQTTSVSALSSDSMQRIGGFAGGMRALGLQQTVVRLNERMVDHLSAIRDAITSPDPV